jgi:hypothetical protein
MIAQPVPNLPRDIGTVRYLGMTAIPKDECRNIVQYV